MEYRSIQFVDAKNVAVKAALNAGIMIKNRWDCKYAVFKKQGNDIVTAVDLKSQKIIVETIKSEYPDHAFYSEENSADGRSNESQWQWIIDPLDGTVNYASGLPIFSVSIALQKNNQTILGIVHDPIKEDIFWAIRGKGSFLNSKRINVSEVDRLSDSVVTFMLTSHYDPRLVKMVLQKAERLALASRGIRLFVSQALELSYIAKGCLEGTVCLKSRGFSSAAGLLIVEEAGGKATDLGGNSINKSSTSLVVTNSILHNEMLGILSR